MRYATAAAGTTTTSSFSPRFRSEGLRQVSANGGEATTRNEDQRGRLVRSRTPFPRLLPGSRRFLFRSTGKGRGEICATRWIHPSDIALRKVCRSDYASSGVLLFLKGSEILAQALDPTSLTVFQGVPVMLCRSRVVWRRVFL